MKTIQLRDAKASLSAVIDAAEKGEATTITKHGRPAAVVMPVADAVELYEKRKPSLASLLLAMPADIEAERDRTPVRDIDL